MCDAHIIERLEPKPGDRAGDRPLQTPLQPQISASSGKAGDGGRRVERNAALVALAEDQRLAHVGDIVCPLQHGRRTRGRRRCRHT